MPVILPRAEAAVLTLVHNEALRVLIDEAANELEIAPPVDRRFQELRFQQLVEAEQRGRAAELVAREAVRRFRPLLLERRLKDHVQRVERRILLQVSAQQVKTFLGP